jgi:DNA-binding CsgD family transcriptional regulator
MEPRSLGRTFALGVGALGVFSAMSDFSMPVPDRRPSMTTALVVAGLLLCQAALYWWGDRARARFGIAAYALVQAAMVFGIAMRGAIVPIVLALYAALTAEIVVIAGPRWGTMPITLGAITLFSAGAALTWDLYRAATVALLLAAIGVIAHAGAALFRREPAASAVGSPTPHETNGVANTPPQPAQVDFERHDLARLTARERDVLRALASGARTSEIASQLDIAERTVKAHLASIYQKLGVESRTAAVAIALQKGQR